jgi:hypothetical protein
MNPETPLSVSYVLGACTVAGIWTLLIAAPWWAPKVRRVFRRVEEQPRNVIPFPDRSNVRRIDSLKRVKG